jgi:hypothetical protein
VRNAEFARSPAAAVAPSGDPVFRVRLGAMTALLALAVLAVVAASYSAAWSLIRLGIPRAEVSPELDQLTKLTKFLLKFDVGSEQTVAAWLSSMLMLFCAMILFYIASAKRRGGQPYALHWLGLSVIFLALSMDEAVGLHEMTIRPLRDMLDTAGPFLYAWVIPALALVAVIGLAYLGFLRHLEPGFRLLFVVAGVLFVGGSIGFEMMEGVLAGYYPEHRLLHEAAIHLEDTLEFAGVLLFLHGLLTYVRRQGRDMVLRLT